MMWEADVSTSLTINVHNFVEAITMVHDFEIETAMMGEDARLMQARATTTGHGGASVVQCPPPSSLTPRESRGHPTPLPLALPPLRMLQEKIEVHGAAIVPGSHVHGNTLTRPNESKSRALSDETFSPPTKALAGAASAPHAPVAQAPAPVALNVASPAPAAVVVETLPPPAVSKQAVTPKHAAVPPPVVFPQ